MGQSAIWYALIAWGFWGFASFQAVQRTHPLTVQWIVALPYFVMAPIWYAWSRRAGGPAIPDRTTFIWGILSCMASLLGSYMYSYALKSEKPALVVSISSAYPLVTVALLVMTGSDHLRWQQVVALAFIIIGVTILQQP